MAGLSVGGSKSKTKSKATQETSGTRTSSLAPDSAALLQQRLAELNGQQYEGLDPNAYKAFSDPFENDVIAATTADINASRGEEANAQRQAMLARGPLGGSDRRGVREAELTGRYDRTLASTIGGLRSAGFRNAQGVAQAENNTKNAFQANIQAQVNQLLQLLASNRVETTNGTTNSTGSGSQMGLNFGWEGK